MRMEWKKLLWNLAIPLAVGGLASLLAGGYDTYGELVNPPLSPPGWVFPVVWTVLYLLMGYAAYRISVCNAAPSRKKRALQLYAAQLAANFLWPLLFFGAGWYLAAFLWLVLLWCLVLLTLRAFGAAEETASNLMIPYFLWVTFALYLNFAVWLLN